MRRAKLLDLKGVEFDKRLNLPRAQGTFENGAKERLQSGWIASVGQ
jgi:hypothetical protein